MKITNKKTGHSFNLNPKEAADFFYAKNAKGEFINSNDDYDIDYQENKISDYKFVLTCISLLALSYLSIYYYLQINY